ncbi:hypothetical protein L7F22_022613 [Adiantum nelumboides]|nr:hypothetical protein [Adiantum nelumboides]
MRGSESERVLMAAAATLADLMSEDVLPERYHPNHLRKSTGKTRPIGGGRTPLLIAKWESFEQELHTWWAQQAANQLAHVRATQTYAKVSPIHGAISKEDGVRAALMMCVFEPVNEALHSGLGVDNFLLNETESIACVKSNVDWAGFVLKEGQDDMYDHVALPIEIKPPWQFKLLATDGHVVDLLLSKDAAQRDKVRFSVAQIFLYMILEEVQFAVLCSKEQYVFLKRIGKPDEKALMISKTFLCADQVGVRKCILYMCSLARGSEQMPRDAVLPTPLAEKLVTPPGLTRKKTRKRASSGCRSQPDRRAKRSIIGTPKATSGIVEISAIEWASLPDEGLPMLSAETAVKPMSWNRWACGPGVNCWFQELAEFDILTLGLSKVLSSAGKVIVREGTMWGVRAAIKMFDFTEGNELLEDFHNEVKAYDMLKNLQGYAVPKLLAFGSLWGHYMGFLALTLEGQVPSRRHFHSQPDLVQEARTSLRRIHAANILHGDVALRNMILSPGGKILYIDFGRCIIDADEASRMEELEDLQELLDECQVESAE